MPELADLHALILVMEGKEQRVRTQVQPMVVQMVLVYTLCTLLECLLRLPAIQVFDLKLPLVLGNDEGVLS